MKRQVMIIAVAFTPLAFFSCTKEKSEMKPATAANETSGTASRTAITYNPNKGGITGYFEFNGDLKDKSGLLGDAKETGGVTAIYTTGRKGVRNTALSLNGRYGLDIASVPLRMNMSVAAWVKYGVTYKGLVAHNFVSSSVGPNLLQQGDEFWSTIITPLTDGVSSGPMSNDWHHLVGTYDGNELKFYVDGTYMGSVINPSYPLSGEIDYRIGYFLNSTSYWIGAIDEVTFYNKTLTDAEVVSLATL